MNKSVELEGKTIHLKNRKKSWVGWSSEQEDVARQGLTLGREGPESLVGHPKGRGSHHRCLGRGVS